MTDEERVAGHERLKVAAELVASIRAEAARWGVDPQQVTEAALGAVGDDPEAAAAQAEVRALITGQAVQAGSTSIPVTMPTMTVRLGVWTPEAISGPFVRSGYGAWRGASAVDLAPSVRGFWRCRAAGDRRVLAFRRGRPVGHFWGRQWQTVPAVSGTGRATKRWWAGELWVVDSGAWLDVDTGARVALDADDQAVEVALTGLVVAWPAGNRNPIGWL